MLEHLHECEKILPQLLRDKKSWNSVYVDYHHPFVARLWRQWGERRIYLHQIWSCKREQSLLHPHPWPSSMKVIQGQYEMGVGYAHNPQHLSEPEIAATIVLGPGSEYEMCHINSWHYVRPLTQSSFSLMVTGAPWSRMVHKSTYILRELQEAQKEVIFREFERIYG